MTSSPRLAPLMLAVFARALPLTMFGPLLPGIARSLGADLAEIGWIVATYATGSLIAQPVMGRLADLRGRRTILLVCLALFIAGSAASAFAISLPALVSGRIVQALGAGGIQPVVTAIIADRWPSERRPAALGEIYGMYGLGTMAGAVLGGALVTGALWLGMHAQAPSALREQLAVYPWHIVFWVNVLVGGIALASAASLPTDTKARSTTGGFDLVGIVLILLFTACAMIAATAAGVTAIAATATALATLVGLVAWERHASAPLFDPSLFCGRGPLMLYTLALCFGVPSFTLTIYSATYFIARFTATEAQAGLALFGLAVAYVVGAIAGGQAGRRAGNATTLIVGLILCCIALAALTQVATEALVVSMMALGGLGLGLASAPPNALLLEYVKKERAGGASGLAIMLATSGSITAPAVASAFLHHGRAGAAEELRAVFAVGAFLCAFCIALASQLPRGNTA